MSLNRELAMREARKRYPYIEGHSELDTHVRGRREAFIAGRTISKKQFDIMINEFTIDQCSIKELEEILNQAGLLIEGMDTLRTSIFWRTLFAKWTEIMI